MPYFVHNCILLASLYVMYAILVISWLYITNNHCCMFVIILSRFAINFVHFDIIIENLQPPDAHLDIKDPFVILLSLNIYLMVDPFFVQPVFILLFSSNPNLT